LGCAFALLGATMAVLAQTPGGQAAPTTEERIAAIKASLAQSAQNVKQYEWIETTVVNFKGEDKSNTQKRCYYGADGKLEKVDVTPPAEDKGKPGLRGKIVANKKEEMADYMGSAVALVKTYIPPDPARIQAAKEAGKISTTPLAGGKTMKIDVKDYEKPGDDLSFVIDMANNKILGIGVASYLTDVKDAVTLDVAMGALDDGTGYPSTITLNGVAKQIKVTVSNGGYKKQVK
jgi:hypothetical protein